MIEIWKDIVGYEGSYQVSNFGNVKSLDRKGLFGTQNVIYKSRILKQKILNMGYYSVNLSKKSKVKTYTVHRLVGKAFIDNPKNKATINHIDGDKLNNRVDNLEWCTMNENFEHAYKIGLTKYNQSARKVMMLDKNGVGVICFYSAYRAAKTMNISESALHNVLSNKSKTVKGVRWVLVNATI